MNIKDEVLLLSKRLREIQTLLEEQVVKYGEKLQKLAERENSRVRNHALIWWSYQNFSITLEGTKIYVVDNWYDDEQTTLDIDEWLLSEEGMQNEAIRVVNYVKSQVNGNEKENRIIQLKAELKN